MTPAPKVKSPCCRRVSHLLPIEWLIRWACPCGNVFKPKDLATK